MSKNEFKSMLKNLGTVEFCGKGSILYKVKDGNLYANGKLKSVDNWNFRTNVISNLLVESVGVVEY